MSEHRSERNSLRAAFASGFATVNAKIEEEAEATPDQIAALRHALIEYHSAVVGNGERIGEFDARVRRMERI